MATRGVAWIGVGDKAYTHALRCYNEFMLRHAGIAGMVLTDRARVGGLRPNFVRVVPNEVPTDEYPAHARAIKTRILDHAPYDQVLHMDADTWVYGDFTPGFDILDDGFDFVIVPSTNQENQIFWHVGEVERFRMKEDMGVDPLQLQGGMWFVARNERTLAFFAAWNEEWAKWRGKDQAALVRALFRAPMRVWLLGHPWNGGAMMGHRFGLLQTP